MGRKVLKQEQRGVKDKNKKGGKEWKQEQRGVKNGNKKKGS